MCAIANRRRLRGLTLRFVALIALAAGAVATVGATPARANYAVQQCDAGLGNVNAFAIRPFGGATKISQTDTCGGSGWGLRMEANGQSNNGTYVVWQWNAAGNTMFQSAQTTLHYYTHGGYGPMTAGSGSPGYSAVGSGGDHWVTPVQNNSTYYAIYEQCFASPCSSTSAFGYITNFYANVVDLSAPSVSASGELLGGGTVSGVQTINASLADSGGGARSIVVYVNGIPSASTDFCPPDRGGSYSNLKPCPDNSGPRALQLDTEHGPGWVNGANEVKVCGYDAGGNQSACIQRTVQVDNSCAGSGGTTATSLDSGADVGGQLRRRAVVTSVDTPVIRGTLSAGGAPVSGATVCIYQTIDLPDAGREMLTQVRTQSNGRFATRLDAGASRTVDLVYRSNTKRITDRVDLASVVIPTLTVPKTKLANGQSAVFLGRIPGPNADGRAVALQARSGRKWRTFKQLKTDDVGNFKGRYRFTRTVGRQRYVFRALVKSQSGYPYEPGASRKRKLIVRG
jgi:hypothetical protein